MHMRIAYCTAMLRDAMKVCGEDPECCGWGWGGDGNCGIHHWSTALREVPEYVTLFGQPHFLEGVGKKSGDLIVATACKTWDL